MEDFLDTLTLAKRWKISPRTLERWRWEGIGAKYIKIGGRVLYRADDILAFEKKGEDKYDRTTH